MKGAVTTINRVQFSERIVKSALMLLLAFSLLFVGCLDSFGSGEIDVVVAKPGDAMTSAQVEAYLNDASIMNLTAMAASEEQFRVEIYSKETNDGESMELTYIIGKDEIAQLYETGMAIESDMIGIEYSAIQGASKDINVRMGNQWLLARDEIPEYVDPFVQLSEVEEDQSSGGDENLPDLTPELDSLNLDLTGFDWTVTIDVPSLQQVATSSNNTHSIMVEFLEAPARLHELEINSNDGNEAFKVTIVWGAEVALSLNNSYPRTSVLMEMEKDISLGSSQDIIVFSGVLTANHIQDVLMDEIELRIGIEDVQTEEFNYFHSMLLTNLTSNVTDAYGDWWDVEWADADGDGIVSSGDSYTVSTNSSYGWDYEVRFYDYWADAYEGGPLPGFELLFLLGAVLFAASFRRTFHY